MKSNPSELGKHSFATRLSHAMLAVAIILQLTTSLVMQGPGRNGPGDWLFETHKIIGLAALSFAAGFWLVLARRHNGTDIRLLFPWFVRARRTALWHDIAAHLTALKSRRLLAYSEESPLASAVHGLGLLLMTAMGLTGALYFQALYVGAQRVGFYQLDLEIHKFLANLVWAYLVGHAGLAVIHHYTEQFSLTEIWSLRPSRQNGPQS